MNIKKWFKWLFPVFFLILIAPWSANLDTLVSSFFYCPTLNSFSSAPYHKLIYHYAVIPALFVGISSGAIFLFSFFYKNLHKIRFPCFFLAASMAVGAGLITHLIFKEFWFRPRPVQTTLFGGLQTFSPFYLATFNFPNFCKSFPSGHATMGFYFINFILLGRRLKNSFLLNAGILLTIIMSGLLCFSRIAQGAHFLTDVLMSLVVTWYSAIVIEKFTFEMLAKNQFLSYTKDE